MFKDELNEINLTIYIHVQAQATCLCYLDV